MKTIYGLLMSLLLLVPAHALGSEITLKNGDRVSGKIIEQTDDAVVIETPYAGKIRIGRSHIERIAEPASAKAAPAVAPVKAGPAPENAKRAAAEEPSAAGPVPVKKRELAFTDRVRRVVTGWDGNANIGFSYTSGNSNNITMTTGLRAVRATPQGGMTIYFRSLWNSNHGSLSATTTQNAFWGGARYDRNLTRKMFGFLSYDFERDKPRRLSFRSVAGGGLGHRSVKNDRTELEFLAGLAWNRTWQAGADTDTPEGLAGVNFKQKINSRFRFQNTFTFFQNVTDVNEYRILFDASVTADITPRVGVYFAVGNRFNNDPLGNAKRNDFLLTTGLKWNFGKKK